MINLIFKRKFWFSSEIYLMLIDFFFLNIRQISLVMAVDHHAEKSPRSESKNKERLRSLYQIIQVLEKFSDNYEKRLNFEKLTQHLKLD